MPHPSFCLQRPMPLVSRRNALGAFLAACVAPSLLGCDTGPGGIQVAAFHGIDVSGADYAQDFGLTDFNGVPRTLADYRGKAVMLYFGFVRCPDVCPTALTRAAEVLSLLGPEAAQRVQLLFITVDPERDTPALLREYMAAFDPSFMALTGSLAQIRATADAFRVFFKKVPTGSTYTMDHTALTYLFDPRGKVRVALRHEQFAAEFAADAQRLLSEPVV